MAPNNYGFYIYKQAAHLCPSLSQLAHFRNSSRNLRLLLATAFDSARLFAPKGPIARTWAWLSVSHFSADMLGRAEGIWRKLHVRL